MAISMEEESYTCPDKIAYQIVCETSNSRACANLLGTDNTAFYFIRGNTYLRGSGWRYLFGGTENQGEHISPLHRIVICNNNY